MEDTDTFRFTTVTGTTTNSYSTTVPNKDTWYHVVGTYNGTHQMIYINGVLEDTDEQTGVIRNGTNELEIGIRNTGSDFANATIDDVRIFNRTLSANEVDSLYQNKYEHRLNLTTSYKRIYGGVEPESINQTNICVQMELYI